MLWSRVYDGGNTDRANSLYVDDHSNILIAGFTFMNTYGDYLILKYAPNGDKLLVENINGEDPGSDDEAYFILSDSGGNIYVTGASQSTSFRMDYLTIKLTSFGHIVWSKRYRTSLENFAYCLNLDNSGNVFVSGDGYLTSNHTGIISIKYSQLTGLLEMGNKEIENYVLTNYPNPSNPNTQINFQIPDNGFIKLIIYDISGREIELLVNEYKIRGQYRINFNSNKYSSGVYFYSLIADRKIVKTNKLLVVK